MKCLVTGAAGFIGRHLCSELSARGNSVIGVDCLTDYYDPALKRRNFRALEAMSVHVVEDDLLTSQQLPHLLREVDTVFHLAGQPGVRASWGTAFGSYLRNNVAVTERLLDACCAVELDTFVYASSSSVYGNALTFPTQESVLPQPISPYGVTKLAGEHLTLLRSTTHGLPSVVLRLFTVFGPFQRPDMAFQRLVAAALGGPPFEIFGDGTQVRDFTYVTDVVDAAILASRSPRPGARYNIAGACPATLNKAIEVVSDLIEREVPTLSAGAALGDPTRTGADTTAAQRDLGWRPAVSLEEGLRRQLEAARE